MQGLPIASILLQTLFHDGTNQSSQFPLLEDHVVPVRVDRLSFHRQDPAQHLKLAKVLNHRLA